MMYMATPKDLLNLARTDKFLCLTLTKRSFDFVWKRVREEMSVPLKDRLSHLSESSYAFFIFDDGPCEVCGKVVARMYSSFSLRVRICEDVQCSVTLRTRFIGRNEILSLESTHAEVLPDILAWFPMSEMWSNDYTWEVSSDRWLVARRLQWENALAECSRAHKTSEGRVAYAQLHKAAKKRKESNEAIYTSVYGWSKRYQHQIAHIHDVNEKFSKDQAKKEGWEYGLMVNSPPYRDLLRRKNWSCEPISTENFLAIRHLIDKHILHVRNKVQKKEDKLVLQLRIDLLVKNHQRLVSKCRDESGGAVPPLFTFLKLPGVSIVSSSSSTVTLTGDFGRDYLPDIIRSDVQEWRAAAYRSLADKLGFSDWNTSRNLVHPAKRLTARFKCKSCNKLPKSCEVDGCLDFIAACLHQCKEGEVWDAASFVRHDQIADFSRRLLAALDIQEDDPASKALFKKSDKIIHCRSCPGYIIMTPRLAIGHSARHETMQFKILELAELPASIERIPGYGLLQHLGDSSPSHERLKALKVFGCRHCDQMDGLSSEPPTESQRKKSQMLTYFGLGSHLKAKHSVRSVRDEDVFISFAEVASLSSASAGTKATGDLASTLQEGGYIQDKRTIA